MKKRTLRGFTLVELIVVIAIIGILAAILVPTMTGYVKKAHIRADQANAKSIYNDVQFALLDDNVYTSSYVTAIEGKTVNVPYETTPYNAMFVPRGSFPTLGPGTSRPTFTDNSTGTVVTVPYGIRVMCSIDAVRNKHNNRSGWMGNAEMQAFCTSLNQIENVKYTKANSKLVLHAKTVGGVKVTRWFIVTRLDDPSIIEIWAGTDDTTNETGPAFRVYPDPMEEYS